MPLFHIQDDDRPMYVIAPNYNDALGKWARVIASENGYEDFGLVLAENPPSGISMICGDRELLP